MAAVFAGIMAGRIRKTQYLRADRAGFLRQLMGELQIEQNHADDEGTTLAVRLNTFSDIPWERPLYGEIPQQFPRARFYDYTKILARLDKVPEHYALCFSLSERNQADASTALQLGHNVAVAFAQLGPYAGNRALAQDLPKTWTLDGHRYSVYDGDATDLRFLDPGPTRSGAGRICGLRLKAGSNATRQAAIDSGFAIVVD